MEIFKLFGSIFVDNAKANESISKTEKHAEGLGSKLGAGIKTAAKWGTALAAGAGVAGTAIIGLGKSTADAGDRIDKLSQKIGMSREGFQQWDYILSQNGTSIDQMQAGMKNLTKILDDANSNGNKSTEIFEQLGISLKGMNQEEAFEAAVIALQGMEDGAKKAALANELFGRSGQELMPLLNGTAGSVEKLKKKVSELGIVMSDEAIDNSVAFTDAYDNVTRSLGGIKNSIGSLVLPMMIEFSDRAAGFFGEITNGVAQADGDMGKLAEVFSDAILKITNKIIEKLPDFLKFGMDIIINLVNGIVKSLPQILKAGIDCIRAIIDGLNDAIPELIPVMIDAVLEMVTTIIDNIDQLIDAGIELILALADGLIEALPILIDKIPIIIEKLVMAIANNLPKIIEAGIKLVVSLGSGLIKAIPQLLKCVPQIMGALIEAYKTYYSKIFDIGKDIVSGLWKGINSMADWVKGKVTGFVEGIGSTIKDFFGIASPSKLMAQYGKYIDEGLAQGIEQNTDVVENAVDVMGNAVNSKLTDVLDTVGDIVSNIQDRITIGEDYYDIGDVRYNTKESNERYKKRKKSNWDKYGDEIDEVANRNNVDRSTAYDMWQQNKTDEMIGNIPKYAKGTNYHPGGLALVGEKGPELVNLERGAEVKTADETRQLLGNKIENIFNISKLIVREEADIKKIARDLYIMQRATTRGAGAY